MQYLMKYFLTLLFLQSAVSSYLEVHLKCYIYGMCIRQYLIVLKYLL